MAEVLVYWWGIIGIPGKGPNWLEPYNPNRTIGELIQTMTDHKLGERGKRIEILKHERGDIGKYNVNDPYWPHNTKLSEYKDATGDTRMMVYANVV